MKKFKRCIMTDEHDRCFVCKKSINIEKHHVMNGNPNRKYAEKDGLFVPLCSSCHRRAHAEIKLRKSLKMWGQVIWQKHYEKTEQDFIARYGKSYLKNQEKER